jgi:hypothetical protein
MGGTLTRVPEFVMCRAEIAADNAGIDPYEDFVNYTITSRAILRTLTQQDYYSSPSISRDVRVSKNQCFIPRLSLW